MKDKFLFGGWVGTPSGTPWSCEVNWEVPDPCQKSSIESVKQEDIEVEGLSITIPEPQDRATVDYGVYGIDCRKELVLLASDG